MPGLLFRVVAARWLFLPLACVALALPAQAQTTTKQTQPATKRARPAAKKPPAKAPARKPAPEAAPAAAPAATASAAAPVSAPAPKPVSSAPREADFIVAVVNTEPLTNHEVRARMARAQRQLAERSMSAPPSDQLRKEMLERLIAERAQLQYAREIGLKVDEAALAQAELAIARQNQLDSIEELHRRVQQEGLTVAEFRADVRNQVLLARLREREIEPKLKVTDAEVEAYIREQTGARTGTVDLNLAMILVAVPEDSSAADTARLQARAAEVVRRARAGEDFAQLALEFSDANNRGRDGGVLGLRAADRYPELFVQSTERARVGEIVGPVRSAAGFHVLKVLERKQNKELPEVRIPQTRARHILLRVGPTQGEQVARDRAADFKRRIQAGQASFEELARQYSQDDSAQDGGDLGWANPGQFTPEFERAMNSLDVRQVSDPVVTRFGVHLIRVDDRREQVLTDAEQRLLARNMLRERKAQEAFETWAQEVRGRAYVEYRDPPR
ncbi:peptidylprolyl isomerase [Ottowia sp.]|uniref:peptidylprolyl isomerase n=1 Tax=Ottowia sp. TaxID=1898956 RepID=UPI002C411286|nr:peptidylprolyl isomerase [Ottowia sp.]HRN76468.1 peptidylprolyl isomerase [Ottowia sp.]HRQ02443.1 peptidylprolyl isomerase [Ottowia sp.]